MPERLTDWLVVAVVAVVVATEFEFSQQQLNGTAIEPKIANSRKE